MRRRLYRLVLIAAVAALAAAIFAFSAQEGPTSDALTKSAVRPMAEMIAILKDGTDAESLNQLYVIFGTFLRKLAHICEYGMLSALLWMLLDTYGRRDLLLPIIITVGYAVTDEVHQAFVPGRLGTPADILIDMLGAVAGAWLIKRVIQKWRKKHVHDQRTV